ncbi:hypothetical protein AGDE_02972 [Angomonas deanei]|uniref:HYDIN/VesB/CFA65-like Ig-like domain-containing protein n=1 Tax=Angomonas deanei TaxID=59799 RepID=A0A7G2CF03_9TRYP|nr:hypothetical protein AGDE_02972 [Angomonas deanei]CAD2218119.1 hypothetical protein, conserved [Angomonas deanei]|eukprot:EPY40953.1 hypothetical protein AGDE_02972 [Angomonas deanei]
MLSKKSKTTTEKKKKEAEGAAAELAPPAAVPLALLEENTSAEEALSSVFDISPRKVIILQFEPSATYEAKLTFKNRTKVNQFLRVAQPASQHFSVSAPKGSESTLKVAPGLAVSYKIVFSAPEAVNLTTELNVKTETEEFTIPVLAFSKQATLALPPQVVMEDCPVKVTTEKSLFLKNNDAQPCTWRAVFTDAEMPSLCSLSPNFGTVAPSEVQPVVIRFNPAQVRPYNGTIRFLLGPEGDLVQDLPLQCHVSELPIALDTTQAVFDDTYVTTEQRREVVLKNTSDTRLDFCWRSSFQTGNDPTEGGPTVFDDEVFSIEPVRGEIYGRGEKHVHHYVQSSKCNPVRGDRLPRYHRPVEPPSLKLSGVGRRTAVRVRVSTKLNS